MQSHHGIKSLEVSALYAHKLHWTCQFSSFDTKPITCRVNFFEREELRKLQPRRHPRGSRQIIEARSTIYEAIRSAYLRQKKAGNMSYMQLFLEPCTHYVCFDPDFLAPSRAAKPTNSERSRRRSNPLPLPKATYCARCS